MRVHQVKINALMLLIMYVTAFTIEKFLHGGFICMSLDIAIEILQIHEVTGPL